ncbi:MAG: class I SAM-dependent methyltransferase [Anaerolineales bacterium]
MWIAFGALATLALIAFWELYICEGAHLGRRFVLWLYRLSAGRYNRIKQYDRAWEIRFLGEPVAQVIGSLDSARILDVGAGTGRLAWALEGSGLYKGAVVCTEPVRAMIDHQLPDGPNVDRRWLHAHENALPFPAASFDLVSSLEMLEFTPNPTRTLRALVRVLRPGGWLLVTNRIGWQAPLIFGRTFRTKRFPEILRGMGLTDVEVFSWQLDYDLAWARKPHQMER